MTSELPGSADSRRLIVGVGAWALAVVGGTAWLLSYSLSPGRSAEPPVLWPSSAPARVPGKAALILVAHPQCSCTRASIGELARLMPLVGDRVSAHVLVHQPPHAPVGWERTDLWSSAMAIPGVRVSADTEGRLAATFGVATSGTVLLYSSDGRLQFHGGITASRGHSGDNVGRTRLLALLSGQPPVAKTSPVFGCSLHDEDDQEFVFPQLRLLTELNRPPL